MNNMEFKPNSHKSKEGQTGSTPEKRVEKVIQGSVKTKKKSGRKLADMFIAEDAGNIGSYIVMDVLVPSLKKAIVDIVTDGVNMLFFGGTGRKPSGTSTSKVSYSRFYDQRDDRYGTSSTPRPRTRFDYDDIVFPTRADAERMREEMTNVIDRYGFVTVADMYDMADLSQPYTSQKYGWDNISSTTIVRIPEGYILKLPKVEPIDKG